MNYKVNQQLLQQVIDIMTNSPTGNFPWIMINNVVMQLQACEKIEDPGLTKKNEKVAG